MKRSALWVLFSLILLTMLAMTALASTGGVSVSQIDPTTYRRE